MLWKNRRESSNIEDQRGMSMGGGRGIALSGGGLIVVIILALVFHVDPTQLLQQMGTDPNAPASTGSSDASGQTTDAPLDPHQEELKKFVGVVLADTEDVWTQIFKDQGKEYHDPTLVLFSGQVQSACGSASAAVGPFYCPGDQKVYLDLSFLDELHTRFGANGDFASAYVVAHEVGHHVQDELGITERVDAQRGRMSEKEANALSVRVELQADFFAGVWAHYDQKWKGALEPGDIDEALQAANQIGDDTLQQEGQGYVVPDSFTHGTSAQRAKWFKLGYDTGDISKGDTFNARNL